MDDRAVAVDEHEAVGEGVEYGREAGSASGEGQDHGDVSFSGRGNRQVPRCRDGRTCAEMRVGGPAVVGWATGNLTIR
ncbi:hypothetical protein [Streptomyces sp. NBC_00691]|uniref:hypothetical protein n=1 Tax=Streptomyces sp. NBC_00691 TaxID=2903671 RepID=UPI002E30BF15|nr:hypothetical protein [Streptomyces sp. NBC_00691]